MSLYKFTSRYLGHAVSGENLGDARLLAFALPSTHQSLPVIPRSTKPPALQNYPQLCKSSGTCARSLTPRCLEIQRKLGSLLGYIFALRKSCPAQDAASRVVTCWDVIHIHYVRTHAAHTWVLHIWVLRTVFGLTQTETCKAVTHIGCHTQRVLRGGVFHTCTRSPTLSVPENTRPVTSRPMNASLSIIVTSMRNSSLESPAKKKQNNKNEIKARRTHHGLSGRAQQLEAG